MRSVEPEKPPVGFPMTCDETLLLKRIQSTLKYSRLLAERPAQVRHREFPVRLTRQYGQNTPLIRRKHDLYIISYA